MNRCIVVPFFIALLLSVAIWHVEQRIATPSVAHAQSGFSCANVSEIPLTECEALLAIYHANPEARSVRGWLITDKP